MKTWVLLLGCLLVLTSQAQTRREVYEWKDANGVTHYSDYPQPGARKITLNGSPPQGTVTPRSTPAAAPAASAASTLAQYGVLEIWTPANDASYFEPDAEIVIRIRTEPELDLEDRLVTYVDGKGLPDLNALEHRLTGLPRGAHTIQSAIYGRDGKEKIRSAPIVIHMKQQTANNPRNQGPALRPPPKPR